MTTHIGREYEVLGPIDKLALRCIKSDELVEYSDTSDVTLFTVPAYTIIVGLICKITTGFTEGSTIVVDDGSTAGLFGQLERAVWEVADAAPSNLIMLWPMYETSSATNIKANVAAVGGATLAAGVSEWWLIFRPVSTDREPNLK